MTIGNEKGVNLGLVLDGSESMAASDYEPTRLDAAKNAITSLVTKTGETSNVGVVLFETELELSHIYPQLKKNTYLNLIYSTRNRCYCIGRWIIF